MRGFRRASVELNYINPPAPTQKLITLSEKPLHDASRSLAHLRIPDRCHRDRCRLAYFPWAESQWHLHRNRPPQAVAEKWPQESMDRQEPRPRLGNAVSRRRTNLRHRYTRRKRRRLGCERIRRLGIVVHTLRRAGNGPGPANQRPGEYPHVPERQGLCREQ